LGPKCGGFSTRTVWLRPETTRDVLRRAGAEVSAFAAYGTGSKNTGAGGGNFESKPGDEKKKKKSLSQPVQECFPAISKVQPRGRVTGPLRSRTGGIIAKY